MIFSSFPTTISLFTLTRSLDMTHNGEFWVAYRFASRKNASPTTQLIELELAGQKLSDLEDVLDHGTVTELIPRG